MAVLVNSHLTPALYTLITGNEIIAERSIEAMEATLATPLVILAIICGFFSSFLAGQKNRGQGGWFILGLFFGIYALITIAAVPALTEQQPAEQQSDQIPRPSAPTPLSMIVKVMMVIYLKVVALGFVAWNWQQPI